MTIQEQVLGPHSENSGKKNPRARQPRMSPLHEAAMRLADLGLSKSRSRTRDLVSLLLSHGARAWRTSQPATDLRLHVSGPSGNPVIRLQLRAR
jgi:hypothetical protein